MVDIKVHVQSGRRGMTMIWGQRYTEPRSEPEVTAPTINSARPRLRRMRRFNSNNHFLLTVCPEVSVRQWNTACSTEQILVALMG